MKNLEYVSYIKNWTMILVVLYHCLCGYSNIWGEEYSWKLVPIWSNLAHILVYFHMPIFTLMSAYLYAYLEANQTYNNTSVFIEKKIRLWYYFNSRDGAKHYEKSKENFCFTSYGITGKKCSCGVWL